MKHLITLTENGEVKAYYTDYFDAENNFTPGMTVFNFYDHTYSTNGIDWKEIEYDHL